MNAHHSGDSNQEVYGKFNIVLNKSTDISITRRDFIGASEFDEPEKIKKFSEYVMNQQNRTHARVVRADRSVHATVRIGRGKIETHGSRRILKGYTRRSTQERSVNMTIRNIHWVRATCEAGW